jgi:hypothetical protein
MTEDHLAAQFEHGPAGLLDGLVGPATVEDADGGDGTRSVR